jgi:hypothetical protein
MIWYTGLVFEGENCEYEWVKCGHETYYKPGNIVSLCPYHADIYLQYKELRPTNENCEICEFEKRSLKEN